MKDSKNVREVSRSITSDLGKKWHGAWGDIEVEFSREHSKSENVHLSKCKWVF